MSWQKDYADKYRTPDEAIKVVKSGDTVRTGWGSIFTTPWALSMALARRAPELENVKLDTTWSLAAELGLLAPGTEKAFTVYDGFAYSRTTMAKMQAKDEQVNYFPIWATFLPLADGPHREDMRKAVRDTDVAICQISPPNKQGFVTFGHQLWLMRRFVTHSKIAIGEVNPELPIIPGGDNWMHVDNFDYLVDTMPFPLYDALAGLSETPPEEQEASEVMCALGAELVDDGDCVMFGGGAFPMRIWPFLENKVDLGCHTEVVIPLDLIEKGVINCRRRNFVPGKVSCTAVGTFNKEEEALIDGSPFFDIRDMTTNNAAWYVRQNDNMVALNAPLEITIWGEIGVERVGMRYFRGVGGQVEMLVGALYSKNGRSVHGMVSRKWSESEQRWVSSIVPQFTYPGAASIPRHFADFVITEYGVASLMGKTERERADELIAIAHPDYREELRQEMKKVLYA
ncbi:MAG: acetyl-CoA hydrolase/transferase C-terminal domain-containing protein [Chloroflexota bacterium]|nr:acetyl-CoA hydrolase/transferase C-terminal domain-containing protein [Chloroflexota bacterium]